jgi:hypothetical protein
MKCGRSTSVLGIRFPWSKSCLLEEDHDRWDFYGCTVDPTVAKGCTVYCLVNRHGFTIERCWTSVECQFCYQTPWRLQFKRQEEVATPLGEMVSRRRPVYNGYLCKSCYVAWENDKTPETVYQVIERITNVSPLPDRQIIEEALAITEHRAEELRAKLRELPQLGPYRS